MRWLRRLKERIVITLLVWLYGCHPAPVVVPPSPPPPTFEDVLRIEEQTSCKWLTHSRVEGEPADCFLIYTQFKRAQQMLVELGGKYTAAKDVKLGALNLYRPERLQALGRRVPVIQLGDSLIQGYIEGAAFIAYAHEYVIFCESLHYLALVSGDEHWTEAGHNTPNDILHFPCWQVIEKDWEEAHPAP